MGHQKAMYHGSQSLVYIYIDIYDYIYFLWPHYTDTIMYLLQTDSFYPAMRLLLPQLDRERGAYGIKEVRYYDCLSICISL